MAQEVRAEDFVPPDEQMAHPRRLEDLVAAYDFDALAHQVTASTSAAADVFGLDPAGSALVTGVYRDMHEALRAAHAASALHPPAVAPLDLAEDAQHGVRQITITKEMREQWLCEDLERLSDIFWEDENFGQSEAAMQYVDRRRIAVVVNLGDLLDYKELSADLSELLREAHRCGYIFRRDYRVYGPSNCDPG